MRPELYYAPHDELHFMCRYKPESGTVAVQAFYRGELGGALSLIVVEPLLAEMHCPVPPEPQAFAKGFATRAEMVLSAAAIRGVLVSVDMNVGNVFATRFTAE